MDFVPADIEDSRGFVPLAKGERLDVYAEITDCEDKGDQLVLSATVLWPAERAGQTFSDWIRLNPRGKLCLYRLGVLTKEALTSTVRISVTPEQLRAIKAWAFLEGRAKDTDPSKVYANPIFDGWSVEKDPPEGWETVLF